MKNTYLFNRNFAVVLFLSLFFSLNSFSQRIYATTQDNGLNGICVLCGVVNPSNAVDGNLQTFSTLTVTVGIGAQSYQELIFSTTGGVPANTPVTLKLGTGNNLIDLTLLGGILLQPFNGNNPSGQPVAAATLVSALTGNNQVEVTLKPNQIFDRVRVTLDAGLLGALTSIYVYDAYYGSGPGPCNIAIDELHGISSTLLGLGLNLGGVVNPERAIDGDVNTASTLNAGVAVLGSFAQQTVIYSSPSIIGDSVSVTISLTPALISAGVLQNISLSTFNSNTDNNDTKTLSSSLLTVRLLDLAGGFQKVKVTFVPTKVFDRVQLKLGGGIASVLSSLNFYEAQHIIPSPVVTVNGAATNSAQDCLNSSVTLTATAVANTVYNWYTTPTGGTAVFTGAVFTTPAITANTIYYVEAMRNGCTDASQRTPVSVTVNPLPANPVIGTTTATVCSGQTATFTAQAVTGVTIKWYAAATGGTPLFTGNTFTTPVLTSNTNFFAEAVNTTGCASAQRIQVSATVQPSPNVAVLSSTAIIINTGQTATITVTNPQSGVTYNWYTAATGGTSIFTGISYTTPALTATTTYYVEGASGTCTSFSRAKVTITVNSLPDVVVVPTTQAVNSGQTATITASSTTPNAVFNWYTTPTGGVPVFTGATFTTPPITANTTYYAEAKNPSTGAVSGTRAAGMITVNTGGGGGSGAPSITVTPPMQAVNAGQTATFTSSSTTTGATFNWYTTPTGGTPIFTGATFTSPPVNGNVTYYAEAKDPTTGAVSTTRATGMVTVNGGGGSGTTGPDITVVPPTQAVNSGQSATFMAVSSTPNATFNWYTTPTGGTPIFTGANFTTPPITANTTYYAEAKDPVSGAVSPTRATAMVTVNGNGGGGTTGPAITVTPSTQAVNEGQTVTFTATSTTPNAVFNWYTTPTGGTPIYTGPTFTSPPINGNVTYYADATDPTTGAVSGTRATGMVTVNGGGGGVTGPGVAVNPPTQAINSGQKATFTATSTTPGATFNWYTVPTGGTSIFTGATFTSPALTANTTYYAEAVDPASGAVSSTRATGMVTINALGGGAAPDITVTPPTVAVTAGQSATFTASSTTPNAIVNWYTVPTGGTPVFTGLTFTTPPVNGNITYYAEAKDPVTGMVSTTRATGMVTVSGGNSGAAPDVAVTPTSQIVEPGQTATFTAYSTTPNATFNWYNAPTGGTLLYTGAVFNTPPVSANTTYYAEAKDPTSGNVSAVRATGMVNVNTNGGSGSTAPIVVVTPPSQNVNTGQTATFTATSTTPGEIFTWYTTPTGGLPIYTGATFTSPPVSGDVTYYAQAQDPVSGITSTTRASGTVIVNPTPTVAVTPTIVTINAGQTVTFTATSNLPNATFNWYTTPTGGTLIFTGSTFITPVLSSKTIYYVEAVNPTTGAASLTRASAEVDISTAVTGLYVPNAFTPNNDGKNDIFYVYGPNIKNLHLWIYDQWGELQFQSTSQAAGWDGTYKGRAQPVGVYVYYVEATANDGQIIKKKGTITLLR